MTALGVVAAVVSAAPASAAVLLSDSFEKAGAVTWTSSGGSWSVATDGANSVLAQRKASSNARRFAGSKTWTDYAVTARVRPGSFAGTTSAAGVLARATSSTTFDRLVLLPSGAAQLQRVSGGTVTVLGTRAIGTRTGTWATLRLVEMGATVTGYVNDTKVGSGASVSAAGRIGVQTLSATASFDDVEVAQDSGTASKVVTVATDGSGNFSTLQAAVDSLPDGDASSYAIELKAGTYTGQVVVPATKRGFTLRGATGKAADVVLTASVSAPSAKSLRGSATLSLSSPDMTVRDLTIENGFGEGAQAVALHLGGDRQVFRNVRVLGHQDTLFADSGSKTTQFRHYFVDSYITGDVDFIFGNSAIVIDRSTVHEAARGGALTAPSTQQASPYGILITDSTITGDAAAGSSALGRPWHPGGDVNALGSTVVRNSTIGAFVNTASPWRDMGGFSWKTGGRFFEYANTGPGAGSGANRPQLTDAQAAQYTAQKYLAGADGWDPTGAPAPADPSDGVNGFASLNALGQNGTTGGKGGATVTVTTQDELNKYVTATEPYVIRVQGAITINPKGTELRVASHKTIVGVGTSGEIVQGGFFLGQGVHNVIIRNLTIRDAYVEGDPDGKCCDWDAIQMDGAHHVWIDHNRLTHMNDGLIDSRKDTSYLTVSWNVLDHHNKAFGIGWTTNTTARITVHHNWIHDTNQRNASTDNVATAHFYNNYLQNITGYGTYARGNTQMVLENCVFDNVANPYYADTTAQLKQSGNVVTGTSSWAPGLIKSQGAAFNPSAFYAYTLDDAAMLPALLAAKAGPRPTLG